MDVGKGVALVDGNDGDFTAKPVACNKFLAKRFKKLSHQELVKALLSQSDYGEYYPEFVAENLRRERLLELLEKTFRGESHKPEFKRSSQFEYGNDKHLPPFPGTEKKTAGGTDGDDEKKS